MDAYEKKIFIDILIGAAFLAMIFIIYALLLIKHNRKFTKLSKAKFQTELDTLERERNRIAADLHDNFAAILGNLKMELGNFSSTTEKQQSAIDRMDKNIDILVENVQEISNNLAPSSLKTKSFESALEDYIVNLLPLQPMKIELRVISEQAVPDKYKVNVFRMSQEIINNAMRHSRADHLNILLDELESNFILRFEDNGIGFNVKEEEAKKSGKGLSTLDARVRIIDGNLFIDSHLNKGTKYTVTFPK